MIQPYTRLKVVDNSGVKMVACLGMVGSKSKTASVGDTITTSVKKTIPTSQFKKGQKVKAVIIRQRKPYSRPDGTVIRFDDNACVLIGQDGNLIGSRISGPVAWELKEKGFSKIISLASEVV